MIFRARATRGLRRIGRERPGALLARRTRTVKLCSPGRRARLGALGGGRVRKSRAVEDQSAPIPEVRTSELGGIICSLGRGAHLRIDQATLSGI